MSQNRNEIPLFFSRSTQSTVTNKTGTWRFSRPVYDEKTAPCSAACPAGEDIARIEMMVSQGHYKKAWETVIMENPFPAVCGRVCFHPCEQSCNRAGFDGAIAIHNIERFIGDLALKERFQCTPLCVSKPENKKIAIAGAGPAGLSAASFLVRLGYACHVFETSAEPGGLMRWGIPDYRLPKNVLSAEIKRLKQWGVKIFCSAPIGENFFEEAPKNYDVLVVACGYGKRTA